MEGGRIHAGKRYLVVAQRGCFLRIGVTRAKTGEAAQDVGERFFNICPSEPKFTVYCFAFSDLYAGWVFRRND